ncbi:hypothetical protein [Paenibacillus sp. MMS20-IR301]|uniref:hypothetical protein n=1 Tax=Paenibacillus sp. MMS20-IR301 TaxID=2895946 RepID=UPI0028F1515C|nr:hypothetical protein [Paenibacillus sp. MMS20-IR301]WNS43093.1 hypothetical protein LOS79_29800 [Paenibacillus sp. MMS20-IR301]
MNFRILTLIGFFTFAFLFSNVKEANALSCAEVGAPQDALALYSGAVYGEVKQIKTDLKQEGFTGSKEKIKYILVNVERSWKHKVDSQIIVATDYTWGFDFKKGNKYLIYISEADDGLSSSPCSPTIELNNLNQATELFGEGFQPQKKVNVEYKMWFMFESDIDLYIAAAVILVVAAFFFRRVKRKKRGV